MSTQTVRNFKKETNNQNEQVKWKWTELISGKDSVLLIWRMMLPCCGLTSRNRDTAVEVIFWLCPFEDNIFIFHVWKIMTTVFPNRLPFFIFGYKTFRVHFSVFQKFFRKIKIWKKMFFALIMKLSVNMSCIYDQIARPLLPMGIYNDRMLLWNYEILKFPEQKTRVQFSRQMAKPDFWLPKEKSDFFVFLLKWQSQTHTQLLA